MNRQKLIEDVADNICDSVDLKDLLRYYYDDQVDYMNSLTDSELIDFAVDMGKEPIDLVEDYGVQRSEFDEEDLINE